MRRGDIDMHERRLNRMFVTRNTEYHVHRDRCVGVRDRRTGEWIPEHSAIDLRITCAIKYSGGGGVDVKRELPEVGDLVCFDSRIMTSAVLAVERPPVEAVEHYRI